MKKDHSFSSEFSDLAFRKSQSDSKTTSRQISNSRSPGYKTPTAEPTAEDIRKLSKRENRFPEIPPDVA